MDSSQEQNISLTVLELLYLNCIVCGLELVASAALVYLPPMLLEAGFEEKYMSWVLGLGPALCLFVVPILGQWMDTCTSRFGRRIPFMFSLSLLVLLALVLIPYADHMVPDSKTPGSSQYTLHVYMLALTVILIDFSTQAGLTPCEVFLQDITKGLPIRDRAFSLYSLMCSVGSCAGYFILAVNWENTFLGSVFGDQEYCVFSLLFVVFLILMVINLRTASKIRTRQNLKHNKSSQDLQRIKSLTLAANKSNQLMISGKKRATLPALKNFFLMITPGGIRSLFTIPYALRRLVYANFFAWAGVMGFLLFYSDYVGEIVYQGKPSAPAGTSLRTQFDEGVRMGSFGLFLHAVLSSFAAPTIEKLTQYYGMKKIHTSCLAIFTISTLLMLFTKNLILINILAMTTGIAFASLTTIPLSLVGLYHEEKEVSHFVLIPNFHNPWPMAQYEATEPHIRLLLLVTWCGSYVYKDTLLNNLFCKHMPRCWPIGPQEQYA